MSRRNLLQALSSLRDRPFAAALGGLLIFSAISTIFDLSLASDALESFLPRWAVLAFAYVYGFSGLLLLLSMVWHRLDVEAAACVVIVAGIAARTVAIVAVLGISVATFSTISFNIIFALGCLERIRQCLRGETIIRVKDTITREHLEDIQILADPDPAHSGVEDQRFNTGHD